VKSDTNQAFNDVAAPGAAKSVHLVHLDHEKEPDLERRDSDGVTNKQGD